MGKRQRYNQGQKATPGQIANIQENIQATDQARIRLTERDVFSDTNKAVGSQT